MEIREVRRASWRAIAIVSMLSLVAGLLTLLPGVAAATTAPGYTITVIGNLGGPNVGVGGVGSHAAVSEGGFVAGYSQIPAVPQVSNPFRAWRWSDAFGTEAIPELPSGSPVAVTQGSAVNSSGDVVGTQSPLGNGQTAFFFSDATGLVDMSDPILPLFSQPQAINESGQVVGYYNTTGNSPARAYIWSLAGGMVDIGPGDPTDWSYTYDVNDLGHVVGAYYFSADQTTHPFFWNSSGATDITNAYGSAQAINESDQVVGSISFPPYDTSHAFMWSPSDGLTDIPELPGSAYASGQFINDSGQVAGTSYSASSDARAFLWSQADGLVDIGTLGGSNSYVYALSSSGDVYGESTTASGARHAFVWSDGDMVDLHQITYPISGMTVEQAYGALADGRIVVSLRTAGEARLACSTQRPLLLRTPQRQPSPSRLPPTGCSTRKVRSSPLTTPVTTSRAARASHPAPARSAMGRLSTLPSSASTSRSLSTPPTTPRTPRPSPTTTP